MRTRFITLLIIFTLLGSNSISANEELSLNTIDTILVSEETKFSDLVPGTQRVIRWFDGVKKTDLSIVYLHGFSASSKEISPTTELLADKLNANIFYSRLTGHGRSEDAMLDGNIEAWLKDTTQAYNIGALIGRNVIIISTSTGGTLATWLSAQPFAKQLLANIMISPNYGIKSKFGRIIKWPWGLTIAKWLNGPYYSFEPLNEVHRRYWTERYPVEAIPPMLQLIDLVEDIDKSVIQIPQLIIYSPDDQVINTAKIEKTITHFTNSPVTVERYNNSIDPAQHVLSGDACSPESTAEVVEMIDTYVRSLIN